MDSAPTESVCHIPFSANMSEGKLLWGNVSELKGCIVCQREKKKLKFKAYLLPQTQQEKRKRSVATGASTFRTAVDGLVTRTGPGQASPGPMPVRINGSLTMHG